MTEAPLSGVAALADRRVDERRVATVMAVVALLLAGVSAGLAVYLPSTAPAVEAQRVVPIRERVESQRRMHERRRWALPLVLAAAVLSLGPIKRAFGFDRGTPLSLVSWPALLVGGHLALGYPLTPTPPDLAITAGLGVLGLGAFLVAAALIVPIGHGPLQRRIRRHGATLGWSAGASAFLTAAWVGLALGPWSLSPRTAYLPLLMSAAAPGALIAAAATLASTAVPSWRR